MINGVQPPPPNPLRCAPLVCTASATLDSIADAWDGLVPRDLPHLRSGFLRSARRGGMGQGPTYLLAHQNDRLVAVALAYTVLIDTAAGAPPRVRRWIERVRRRAPRFLWRPMRICGPPVSNGECGVYFHPQLPAADRRQVLGRFATTVLRQAGFRQTVLFKDFDDATVAEYANALEVQGFFSVAPGPGTRLDLRWDSWDGYMGALRNKSRNQLRQHLRAAGELEFRLHDSFADLAPAAAALYGQVQARAEYSLETATPAFFDAVAQFDQAKLLVARHRATGEMVGMGLMLFGDTCAHGLYMGLDYAANERFHTYFNLVMHSLRAAIERGMRVCYLGPTAYEFKLRLGATPFALTAYMKHRLWPVHRLLRNSRGKTFPKRELPTFHVFHSP
jgi:predicted N-acyltransferase